MVAAGADGPWAAQGIELSVEQVSTLTQQPYPLGLINVSKPNAGISGASRLVSTDSRMALAAWEYYPTTLLRHSSTLVWRIRRQPACVAAINTVRSILHRSNITPPRGLRAIYTSIIRLPSRRRTLTAAHRIPWPRLPRVDVGRSVVDGCGIRAGPGEGCDTAGGS